MTTLKTIHALLFFALTALPLGKTSKNKKMHVNKNQLQTTSECSNLYPFQDYYINLNDNETIIIDSLPSEDFKTCSKYAHRFTNIIADSVKLKEGNIFVIDKNKEKGIYNINIFDHKKLINTIALPVEKPLPEVHEYYIYLFPYKDDVIMYMEDWYSTHYIICKYSVDGKEIMRKKIEHTYITNPEPTTDKYNRYLYFNNVTASQMIFTSHVTFSNKPKTIVLSLDDFAIVEYDTTANGLIFDKNEKDLAGFVTQIDDHLFSVQIVDNTPFEFKIKYGSPTCDFILRDNLLYIANYHPIVTGSSLQCFDINTKKMKWTADVKQIMASHSKYANKVTLSMYRDKIIMEGNESYGDYVQLFDAETGKKLAVFGDVLEIKE